MVKKIKDWIKATGLENLGWAGGCAASLLFIGGSVGTFLGGACAGLFIYMNYAVIKELIKNID
jgi:hypothetical protein